MVKKTKKKKQKKTWIFSSVQIVEFHFIEEREIDSWKGVREGITFVDLSVVIDLCKCIEIENFDHTVHSIIGIDTLNPVRGTKRISSTPTIVEKPVVLESHIELVELDSTSDIVDTIDITDRLCTGCRSDSSQVVRCKGRRKVLCLLIVDLEPCSINWNCRVLWPHSIDEACVRIVTPDLEEGNPDVPIEVRTVEVEAHFAVLQKHFVLSTVGVTRG